MLQFAIAIAGFLAVASGKNCPATELTKLTPLASSPNVSKCEAASGYTMIPPAGLPTDDQLAKMCKNDACIDMIAELMKLDPSDCDLNVGSVTINVHDLGSNFDSDCAKVGSSVDTASSTKETSASGSASSTTETEAPATTAPAPSTEDKSTASSAKEESAASSTEDASTPTVAPTPAPTMAPKPQC